MPCAVSGSTWMSGERKPFQAKRARVRALRTGSWASTGKLGRVTTKAIAVRDGHPPEGDAELGSVGFGTDGGELEVLVGGEFGDDGREERNHPELAEEDEREDGDDEDDGGEDSFHWS